MDTHKDEAPAAVLTTQQAAEWLRVSTKTISRMASDGRLPYRRLGGSGPLRFLRSDIEAILAAKPPTKGYLQSPSDRVAEQARQLGAIS